MIWYGLGWMSFVGPLMMVAFWGGIILLAVWAFRRFTGGPAVAKDYPQEILRGRLAAGEITPEQYEQTRKALQG
jgi:uncharacterized membrane protein